VNSSGSTGKLCLVSAIMLTRSALGAEPAALATIGPAPAAPEPPAKLAAGQRGSVNLGALIQTWGFWQRQDGESSTTFRIRRAELKLKGELVPKRVLFNVMVDPAKVLEPDEVTVPVENQEPAPVEAGTVTVTQPPGAISMLQDVSLTFRAPYADVTVGQFKLPLSLEGYGSSSKLVFPERALVSRRYGDKRDIGVRIDKEIDRFYYNVGIYNGAGQNRLDTNDQKDLAARFEAKVIPELTLAVAGAVAVGERDTESAKDRLEGDVRFEFASFLVQAEYIRAWDGPSDERVPGHGAYAALGYRFFDFQPVVRVGRLEPDLDGDGQDKNDAVDHYEVGLNYYWLEQEVRFGASASWFDFDDLPVRTEIIALAQASF
jgi:hypothetical protein